MLRRFGVVLGRSGTRSALQFITDAPSGRARELPRGVRVRVEFDSARVERVRPPLPDRPVVLPHPAPGAAFEGRGRVGGRGFRVLARRVRAGAPDGEERISLPLPGLRLPLTVRGRGPGDRIRTPGGTKTLRKWLIERRVPRSARDRLRLVADAEGAVLWVVGVGRSVLPEPAPSEAVLEITIVDDD